MNPTQSSTPHYEVAWASDIGMKRSQNQDSAGSFPEQHLFIVADGMGGHRGGEVASKMAVETLSETFLADLAKGVDLPGELLSHGTACANAAILERSRKDKELEGMGTTTTSLHFRHGKAYVGHVGDSRCYLIRPDGIWQITRDHSLVQEKLRAGIITRAQVKSDRMKNVITRSVGFDLNFSIDVYEYAPTPGDVFLMCSDGLTGLMEDSEILNMVRTNLFDNAAVRLGDLTPSGALAQVVEKAITLVNSRGGDDNVTVVMVQFKASVNSSADAAPARKSHG